MMRLKSKLLSLNADKATPVKIYSPANCEELRIPFRQDKIAKVVGRLANIPPPQTSLSVRPKTEDNDIAAKDSVEQQLVSGVLVQSDFKLSLMAPEDLKEYAGLNTTTITCRQRLTLAAASPDLIRWALEGTFGALKTLSPDKTDDTVTNGNGEKQEEADEEISRESARSSFVIMDCVTVHCGSRGAIEVEWEGNMVNDGIADAVLAVLFTVESSPAAVKRSSQMHSHSHSHSQNAKESYSSFGDSPLTPTSPGLPAKRNPHAIADPETRFERLCMFLEAQFGADNVSPITHPRPISKPPTPPTDAATPAGDPVEPPAGGSGEVEPDEKAELNRLHALGIPVPGIEIKVDKNVANVWLEGLEVECKSAPLKARVKAIVDGAVEVVSPLWVER